MVNPSRRSMIVGNWKMYKTIDEALAFIRTLNPLIQGCAVDVYLAVPFTMILVLSDAAMDTSIIIGAQNMNDVTEGAFTGEIAGKMLKDSGASFVILGHSERRLYFRETNEFINRKVKRAVKDHLLPIVCVGESGLERDSGQTEEVLRAQILGTFEGIESKDMEKIVLAYEPVWAIGTGNTATPEIANEAHRICRTIIQEKWGEETAKNIPILYGGSVKPENTKKLMEQGEIDGLLVGGASLSVETFSQIVNYNRVTVEGIGS